MEHETLSPKRRAHLEWIRSHQPVGMFPTDGSGPSLKQARVMEKEGDIEQAGQECGHGLLGFAQYRLTAQGRQKLAEAEANVGRDAVEHLRTAYPAALEAVPATAAVSLRNFINSRVEALLRGREGATPNP